MALGTTGGWETLARLRYHSNAPGRQATALSIQETHGAAANTPRGASSGIVRWPTTKHARHTGRNTLWELHYREKNVIRDADRLTQLFDAVSNAIRRLRAAGDTQPGPRDW